MDIKKGDRVRVEHILKGFISIEIVFDITDKYVILCTGCGRRRYFDKNMGVEEINKSIKIRKII
jgi:hypothetical protein